MTNLTKTQADIETIKSANSAILHFECNVSYDNLTWTVYDEHYKKIVTDFDIPAPADWTGTFRRPSTYLGELLAPYDNGAYSDCYAVTHRFLVPAEKIDKIFIFKD